MALCDELELKLGTAQAVQGRLLDAVAGQAAGCGGRAGGEWENRVANKEEQMKAAFIGVLFVGMLAACAPQMESVLLTGETYPPTDPSRIRIFNQTMPEQPFIEIGIVKIKGKKRHTMTQMINMMRQQAAAQGADAILLRDPKEVHAGYVASGSILIAIQNKVLQGTTIRYKERPQK